MGWCRLEGCLKLHVSFAKEPYKRDHILQKRPTILSGIPEMSQCVEIYVSFSLICRLPHVLEKSLSHVLLYIPLNSHMYSSRLPHVFLQTPLDSHMYSIKHSHTSSISSLRSPCPTPHPPLLRTRPAFFLRDTNLEMLIWLQGGVESQDALF